MLQDRMTNDVQTTSETDNLQLEQGYVVQKVQNIPKIRVRKLEEDKSKEMPEEPLEELLQMMDVDSEQEQQIKPNKSMKRKTVKRDEHGKKLLTPTQHFILQINGWLGQYQQALYMMERVKNSGNQDAIAKYEERISRFKKLVDNKLEEAKLIGFQIEFYEGTGRYRGQDKAFTMPEITIMSEETIQEVVDLHFVERLEQTTQALTTSRQALNMLSIQGRFQTAEFQQHLMASTKLEVEETTLRNLKIEIKNIIHALFSSPVEE